MTRDARTHKRDRHGRGMRGPMMPPRTPAWLSRNDKFIELVREAITNLDERHGSRFRAIEISVELIPTIRDLAKAGNEVALGRLVVGEPNRVLLYRRPIELRSDNEHMRMHIIKDVLAEKIAELWGMTPSEVDPEYLGPNN